MTINVKFVLFQYKNPHYSGNALHLLCGRHYLNLGNCVFMELTLCTMAFSACNRFGPLSYNVVILHTVRKHSIQLRASSFMTTDWGRPISHILRDIHVAKYFGSYSIIYLPTAYMFIGNTFI